MSATVVVKVEYKGELRRISMESSTTTLTSLKAKLASMFAIESDFAVILSDSTPISSDEECQNAFAAVKDKKPPVLRVTLTEQEVLPVVEEPIAVCATCLNAIIHDGSVSYHFRCVNCPSDICADCEKNELHNSAHLLVKLRQPYGTLTPEQQRVFTEFLEIKPSTPEPEAIQQAEPAKEEPAPVEVKPEQNMNVSLLMSEFQEVIVPEPAKPVEQSIEKEVASWETETAVPVAVEEECPKPTEEEQKKEDEAETESKKPNPFQQNLETLELMGFGDREKNIELLVKHVNNLERTIEALLHSTSTKGSLLARLGFL